jgi:outer membrane protein assembly factor BamD
MIQWPRAALGGLILCVVVWIFTTGCDPYKSLRTSSKLSDRDSAAMKYYNDGLYETAASLFEELVGIYRGSDRSQEMLYYYALCQYQLRMYIAGAHYFERYINEFPTGPHIEACYFMRALCHFKQSATYDLDQSDSEKAIEEFELYITQFPTSKRVAEARQYIKELKAKLAKKSYMQAAQLLKISHYKAATISFKNFIQQYPDNPLRSEAQYMLLLAATLLAENSIESKREERILEAIAYYQKYIEKYPSGKYKKEAENLYARLQRGLKALHKHTNHSGVTKDNTTKNGMQVEE